MCNVPFWRVGVEMLRRGATYTLGCKVNQTDTETVEGMLQDNGYEIVDFEEIADVYIINTCTVTSSADKKSRQIIRRVRDLGESRDSIVIVMGCYAQSSSEDILKKLGVDLVIGNSQRAFLMDHLNKFIEDRVPRVYVDDIMEERNFEQIQIKRNITRTRAFLKIQEGCQQFCSYCIIPYTRGPIRSKNPEDVIRELQDLEEKGFHEVVLTGIHIGSYGKDFLYEYDFEKILKEIIKNTKKMRIRISSIEPTEVTEEIAILISAEDRICNHLHIPLQSGDDFILKKMNRPYDTEYFRKKLEMIRSYNPEIGITTDIMVGFPYEKEINGHNTLKFAEEMQFSDIHVFKYSPRQNTPASKFPEQVILKDKNIRSRSLITLTKKMKKRFLEKFVNTEMEVLLEQKHGEFWEGHTSNYLKVRVKGQGEKNQFCQVYIEKAEDELLIGKKI